MNRAQKLASLASSLRLQQRLGDEETDRALASIEWSDDLGSREVRIYSLDRVGWKGQLWKANTSVIRQYLRAHDSVAHWKDTRPIPHPRSEVALVQVFAESGAPLAVIDQTSVLEPASAEYLDRLTALELGAAATWSRAQPRVEVKWRIEAEYALDQPKFLLEIGRRGNRWVARNKAARGWRALELKDEDLSKILPSHLL
jgi:hypothetical protein